MPGYASNSFIFQKETATPGTYAVVLQCMNVTPVKTERNKKEVYVADSQDPVILLTTRAAKMMEATFLFDPANVDHQGFKTDIDAKTARNYRIIYPDPGAYQVQVNATPVSYEPSELDGEGSEITLKVSFALHSAETVTV